MLIITDESRPWKIIGLKPKGQKRREKKPVRAYGENAILVAEAYENSLQGNPLEGNPV